MSENIFQDILGKNHLQSPHEIGSYLGGFISDVHDGTTPSTQLKLRPRICLAYIYHLKAIVDLTEKEWHGNTLKN